MPVLNPSRQTTVGIEWAPYGSDSVPIGTTPGRALVFPATVTENISALSAYMAVPEVGKHQAVSSDVTRIVCDIYDASVGDPLAIGAPQTLYALPVVDGPVSGTPGQYFTGSGGGTSNLFTAVDEQVVPGGYSADYIHYISADQGTHGIRFRGNTALKDATSQAVTALTGKRVAAVHIKAAIFNYNTVDVAPVQVWGVLGMVNPATGGVIEQRGDYYTAYSLRYAQPTWSFRTNPITGLPWTTGDVAQFLNGGTGDFGLRFSAAAPGTTNDLAIYSFQIEVVVVNETRVATGYVDPTTTGWQDIALRKPSDNTTQNWAKTTDHDYWCVLWRASGGSVITARRLLGDVLTGSDDADVPLSTVANGIPTGDDPTFNSTLASKIPARGAAFAITMTVSGGAFSADSQPYALVRPTPISALTHVVEQELSDLALATYGRWSVAVRAPATALPTEALIVEVIDLTASDTLVAGPALLYPSSLPADDGAFHVVRGTFPVDFTPLAGHRYALVFASATSTAAPWFVTVLDTGDTNRGAASYRGTTDVAVIDGTRTTTSDVVATLQRTPLAPGNFALNPYTRTLVHGPGSAACTIAGHTGIRLNWTATDPGGTFAYWEVQRSDGPDGYQTIAKLTDVGTLLFYDFEARRDITASYRMRQVRADGAASDWTATLTGVSPSLGEGLVLATNVDPDLIVAYQQDGGTHPFDFLDAANVVTHQLFGRDYQVAFQPTEKRGDHFKRTLVVGFAGSVWAEGRQAFDKLVALTTAPIPYVCVLDSDGNRWFASVKCASGTRQEPVGKYTADIEIIQTTRTPAAPTETWSPS